MGKTARFFLAAPNPRRPWQKQVRTGGGKCPLKTTTDHPQTASETAGQHENGSGAPRPLGKSGSVLEISALHRSARDTAALASPGIQVVLEIQVQSSFFQTHDLRGDRGIDQGDGKGQSTVGS